MKNGKKSMVGNLPNEISIQRRFFAVGKKKGDVPNKWNEPANQTSADEAFKASNCGRVGFDISGHGVRDDYLLIDFDKVLNDDGEFVTTDAEQWFNYVAGFESYCERSLSGKGFHFLFKPAKKFAPVTNREGLGVLHLDADNPKCKVELFYKNSSRYCLVTGDVYGCEPQTPIIEGEPADECLQTLLNEIKARTPKSPAHTQQQNCADDADYTFALAKAILSHLATLSHTSLSYNKWLGVNTACKNIGLPFEVVDEMFNRHDDGGSYNRDQNVRRWQGLEISSNYGIHTLIGIACEFGFDKKSFDREFFAPYLKGGLTDMENAKRLERYCGSDVRWLTDDEHWLIWQEAGFWRKGSSNASALSNFVGRFSDLIANAAGANADKNTRAIVNAFQSRNKIANSVELLKFRSSILITADDLDKHKNLLNCQNGVVDLETGNLYPFDKSKLLTQQAAACYEPNLNLTADNLVTKFFRDIMPDEETRCALLRWLGYNLTGDVREEKFLLMLGDGANGKGVLTRLVSSTLASYAASLPKGALSLRKFNDGNGHTAGLNKMIGCRFVVCEELSQHELLDSALLKTLAGGDLQTFRELHKEYRIVEPTGKLNFSSNFVPKFENSDDEGIKRRFLVAPFTESFTNNRADKTLKDRLLLPENKNIFMKILVDEAQRWYRDGLIISAQMAKATRDNLLANDFVNDFLLEFCERDAKSSIPRRALLDKLRMTYPQSGRFSDRDLVNMIQKHNVEYRRGTAGFYYFKGIRFTENYFAGAPVDENDIAFDE